MKQSQELWPCLSHKNSCLLLFFFIIAIFVVCTVIHWVDSRKFKKNILSQTCCAVDRWQKKVFHHPIKICVLNISLIKTKTCCKSVHKNWVKRGKKRRVAQVQSDLECNLPTTNLQQRKHTFFQTFFFHQLCTLLCVPFCRALCLTETDDDAYHCNCLRIIKHTRLLID